MGKLSSYTGIKCKDYINTTSLENLSIVRLLQSANTGKTKYNLNDLANYLISQCAKAVESEENCTKIIEKYWELLVQYVRIPKTDLIKQFPNFEIKIDEDMLKLLASLPAKTQEYFIKQGEEMDDLLDFKTLFVPQQLGFNITCSYEDEIVSNEEITNDVIKKLKEENENLNKKLEESLVQIKKLTSEHEKTKETTEKATKDKLVKITKLESNINELNKKISDFELSSSEKDSTIKELSELVKNKESLISELNNSLVELNKKLEENKKCYNEVLVSRPYVIGQSAIFDEKIDLMVLTLISKNNYTAIEILNKVKEYEPNVKINDIYGSLRRLSYKFCIQNPNTINVPEIFTLSKPNLQENKTIILPTNGSVRKMIFTSDFHLSNINDFSQMSLLERKMNSLHEYAKNNEIDMIVDLGDLFDSFNGMFNGSDNPQRIYDEVSLLSERFSNNILCPDFKYILLGGNHDESITEYGFDPYNVLKEYNPNVIPCGYHNAILKVGEDTLGIHHEGAPRGDMYNVKEFVQRVVNVINEYYSQTNRPFFDFFGHIHNCVIDGNNNFACVPSMFRNRESDGALEVDVYLDQEKKIDYLVISTLSNPRFNIRKVSETPVLRRSIK